MKTLRAFALLALPTLVVAFAGCGEKTASTPIVKSRDEVWDATVKVLQEQRGYPGFEEMDKTEGTLATRWRFKPSIHAFDSRRHRVEVELVPAEPPIDPKTGKEQWVVKVAVEVERNEEMIDPTNYYDASWNSMGRDPEEEMLIVDSIYFAVRDWNEFGPSEEARRLWEKKEQYEKEIADLKAQEERHNERLRELDDEAARLEAQEKEPKSGIED